jgi:hypothetical protein
LSGGLTLERLLPARENSNKCLAIKTNLDRNILEAISFLFYFGAFMTQETATPKTPTTTKKVTRKMVTIDGKKVPYFICPPGMSGQGLDLEKHFNQEDKEEATFEVAEEVSLLEDSLIEDIGFVRSYQRYCDEGEITSSQVEDLVNYKQATKYYDSESDRNQDLVTIFNQ